MFTQNGGRRRELFGIIYRNEDEMAITFINTIIRCYTELSQQLNELRLSSYSKKFRSHDQGKMGGSLDQGQVLRYGRYDGRTKVE